MARVKIGTFHQKPQLNKLFKLFKMNSSATDVDRNGKTCCVQVGENTTEFPKVELEYGGILTVCLRSWIVTSRIAATAAENGLV